MPAAQSSVMLNLKSNQFSEMESEDCNAHLTHFMDACSTINPAEVSESDKRLKLFEHESYYCQRLLLNSPLKLAPERIEPETLRRSILQGPKPTPPDQLKWAFLCI